MIQMGDASADEEGKDVMKEYLEEHQEKFPSGEFKEVPPWRKHITVMGIVASFVIGSLYSLVIIKDETHHWTGSQPQCLGCACRIYCYSIMDKAALEVWDFIDSVYSTGEYVCGLFCIETLNLEREEKKRRLEQPRGEEGNRGGDSKGSRWFGGRRLVVPPEKTTPPPNMGGWL
ncbi:hypothetical protein Sjap_012532 [Stephania japonica]|uniref:Uncharacterized protein n=1 Tax=Stephania japonica TaxID=461633 RepID=A0AAP0IWX6_9MAGN